MNPLANSRDKSLLMVGAHVRLLGALGSIALLWLAVAWALQGNA